MSHRVVARDVGQPNVPIAGRRFAKVKRETTPTLILFLFCIYVLAWFWQVSRRVDWLEAIRFEFVLGTFLAFVSVAMLVVKPPRLGGSGPALVGSAAVLFLLISIQVPISTDPALAWTTYVDRVVKFGFWAVFIAAFVRSERDLRWFIAAFMTACVYITYESVRGGLFGGMMWQNQGVMRLHGPTPLFEHPNSLAGLALGLVPFAMYLFPIARSRAFKVVLAGSIGFALVCIVLTGSRTAYIGVIALAAFAVIKARWRVGTIMTAGLVAAVILAVLAPQEYKARFETLFTGKEIEGGSMDRRMVIIEDSFAILAEHPLGVGVDGFRKVRMDTFGRFQDTHNLYLQVATHAGIQGLIAFLVFVWAVWRALGRVAWQPDTADVDDRSRFVIACARATQAYLFARLLVGLFGHDLYEVYWWLALGLAISLTSIAVERGLIAPDEKSTRRALSRRHAQARTVATERGSPAIGGGNGRSAR